jgi:uncharacterized membrane protein YdfJ with MMPL/SSD domain
MNQEIAMRVGVILGIVVAGKTLSVWTYGQMMKIAKENYELARMDWAAKSQNQFEILVLMTCLTFLVMVMFTLLGNKMATLGTGYAFMLLMDTFVFMAIVVPSMVSLGKGPHRWFRKLAV